MFNFFKKDLATNDSDNSFDIELIAYALAYEIAVADGGVDKEELLRIKLGLSNVAKKKKKSVDDFNKEQKYAVIKLLWETAYADNVLEVNEDRLIRRIADLIGIKHSIVLKLREEVKSQSL